MTGRRWTRRAGQQPSNLQRQHTLAKQHRTQRASRPLTTTVHACVHSHANPSSRLRTPARLPYTRQHKLASAGHACKHGATSERPPRRSRLLVPQAAPSPATCAGRPAHAARLRAACWRLHAAAVWILGSVQRRSAAPGWPRRCWAAGGPLRRAVTRPRPHRRLGRGR